MACCAAILCDFCLLFPLPWNTTLLFLVNLSTTLVAGGDASMYLGAPKFSKPVGHVLPISKSSFKRVLASSDPQALAT